MPIAGIPFVQNGMDTFNGNFGFDNLMKQILERKQLAQQKELQEAANAQREREFQSNLGLRQQAENRASQLFPLQLQAMRDAHMRSSPEYKAQQFKSMMNAFGGGDVNEESMKKNPMLRGFFKSQFGFDPLAPEAQTPEQKKQNAIEQAIAIDEAKANRAKIDEIEKTSQALMPYAASVKTINDILKNKPDLVGRTTQLADALGLTEDTDVGTFLSAAQKLQSQMAHEMSGRGGYGVSKLVEQAKPNLGKSTAYNQGVIDELKSGMKDSFNQLKSEYERLSNKKFPYSFEQYFEEETGQKSSSSKKLKYNPSTGRVE